MKEKYYPPSYKSNQFHCIQCGVFARQYWYDLLIRHGVGYISSSLDTSKCSHCDSYVYWHGEQIIIPDSAPVELPHPDLPQDCIKDYEEARSVFTRSPRSSAALLRLCIQKLLPQLGESGKNINDDIKSLVSKGLPTLVQKALDYCRVVGNNAVHPGEINLEDTPEIAQNLFRMVNFIVEDRITRPREIEELYNQLPENSRKAIENRDNGTSATST